MGQFRPACFWPAGPATNYRSFGPGGSTGTVSSRYQVFDYQRNLIFLSSSIEEVLERALSRSCFSSYGFLMTSIKATRKMSRPVNVLSLALALCCLASIATAQSTDIASPAGVRTNEVLGTIAARDIGDPRLTDHYYAFTGTPGDLLLTVDSRNLNGDVDVFTTSGLRPLLKLTVYAGNSSPTTKSIYLRKRENLILRIEARSPNDDDGTYRLYFGGSFEPITSETLLAENETAATELPSPGGKPLKKGRRVSSVGARIEEPPAAEVAAAPTPEPSPLESPPSEEAKTEEAKSSPARSEVTNAEVTKAPARTARGRRPPGRRTPPPAPPKEAASKGETENAPRTENTEAEAKPSPTRKRPPRKTTTSRTVANAPAPVEPEPESGPRLVIETNDGTLINRYMSSVRRVVVEKGQVVVTGKDGKIERIPLGSVVRMSIAP